MHYETDDGDEVLALNYGGSGYEGEKLLGEALARAIHSLGGQKRSNMHDSQVRSVIPAPIQA